MFTVFILLLFQRLVNGSILPAPLDVPCWVTCSQLSDCEGSLLGTYSELWTVGESEEEATCFGLYACEDEPGGFCYHPALSLGSPLLAREAPREIDFVDVPSKSTRSPPVTFPVGEFCGGSTELPPSAEVIINVRKSAIFDIIPRYFTITGIRLYDIDETYPYGNIVYDMSHHRIQSMFGEILRKNPGYVQFTYTPETEMITAQLGHLPLQYACEAVCEEVAECRSKGTYCKSWHTPQSCFGLYWSGGGKMCYQPGDANCLAESPVLCVEVAPHALPTKVESSTAPSTTATPGTTSVLVTTNAPATTTPEVVTTGTLVPSSDSSTIATSTDAYEEEGSTGYLSSTLPTSMLELIPASTDTFYDAVGNAAAAVMADNEQSDSPYGRYCGLVEGLVPISMYFTEDTFDLAGVSENDIEGIPYSLSASGCIIPDYEYPPFEDALGSTLAGNPFYVKFDRSKREIRGTVAGGKITATSC
ncbi:hypothetical protein FOL47_006713 [Perkinsus chesapeaki]|uniref:Uncharacterized protein n=1 Tax=Perkinsus chesapeaki TaxID=330153 RepID=A0A7J6MWY4_PERCH|nr:hypothetical protein FOL47_006713 [Perkinsus chesapeaki]